MSKKALRIVLLVEDNLGDARLLREMFDEQATRDTEVVHVQCMREAEEHLAGRAVDIVLLDLGLRDARGLEAIRRARAAAPGIPLVVLTGMDDEAMATQALQEGAQDYLIKGQIETRGLLRSLRYAVERKTMEEALFVEKERAQVTLQCIGDAVACTDASGRVTFLNVVAERITGWPGREAAGRTLASVVRILDGTGRDAIPNPMEMKVGLDRTAQLSSNFTLVPRDGPEVPIEASVAPIRDRKGRPTGAVIVFRVARI
jgi:PAS domain S-box-containing protein